MASLVVFATTWLAFTHVWKPDRFQLFSAADVNDSLALIWPTRKALPSFPFAEDSFAAVAVGYPGARARAKALLDDQPIAIPDPIDTLPPALDQKVELALPSSSIEVTPSVASRRKPDSKTVSRLARITVYWPQEGDYHTRNRKSSTGVRLRDGHCAVDPKIIPYGSVVHVPQIGSLIAVDTGSAVMSRRAAKRTGRTPHQRSAIVIDVFCSSGSKAKALIKRIKHFTVVTWQRPKRSAGL